MAPTPGADRPERPNFAEARERALAKRENGTHPRCRPPGEAPRRSVPHDGERRRGFSLFCTRRRKAAVPIGFQLMEKISGPSVGCLNFFRQSFTNSFEIRTRKERKKHEKQKRRREEEGRKRRNNLKQVLSETYCYKGWILSI